jgi:hypothetical protein
MRSAEIKQLLEVLRKSSVTDAGTLSILQKLRTDAMATKDGLQRLVSVGCVPCILKLLYRYVSLDHPEREKDQESNERTVSLALSIVANILVNKEAKQQVSFFVFSCG